ncbi:MAG: CdaR family protein, partial [Firmicutes bacterium]|nr:CdaR family protein [Bacillota bacterium]
MSDPKEKTGEKPGEKNGRLHTLLRDRRVLMGISLLLAVVVWLVLAVINGDMQPKTIEKVPVRADFSGTLAEEMGLQPFWAGPLTDPHHLTVDVVVKCKRYENITADTLEAVLMVTGNEYPAGEHNLAIRVTPKREADRDRYELVSVTPASIWLYFDRYKSLEFGLTPAVVGEVSAAEGYYADALKLSKKGVSVSGPAQLVDAITLVKAEVNLGEETYGETAVFTDIPVYPVDSNGDTSPYLTVEEGEVNATLPVWKRVTLVPAVTFEDIPPAYLGEPLPVKLYPAELHAALPKGRIAEDLRYSVGTIDFRALSPGNNRFSFPAEDLKEIKLFDDTETFTAVVNLAGFDTARFTLPGAQAQALPDERFAAQFEDVANVVVVGPADVVKALAPSDLAGEAVIPADA